MPNVEFFGYKGGLRLPDLVPLVNRCMVEVGLKSEAVKTIHYGSVVAPCDDSHKDRPYLRLLTSEKLQVISILSAFQRSRVWEDVEVIAGGLFLFFEGKEVKTGLWREKIPRWWKFLYFLRTELWTHP